MVRGEFPNFGALKNAFFGVEEVPFRIGKAPSVFRIYFVNTCNVLLFYAKDAACRLRNNEDA